MIALSRIPSRHLARLSTGPLCLYYGPPSLGDYLNYHNGDRFDAYMLAHVHFTRLAINVLSGPSDTSAYVVFAFGLYDRNVVASVSTSSVQQDFPTAHVYDYAGAHGVSINEPPGAARRPGA